MSTAVKQHTFVASDAHTWGSARVTTHARVILANNPSPLTYLGTNTWVLANPGSSVCVVVDPGPDKTEHLRAVQRACAEDKCEVAAILLTHDHLDHAEGAKRFSVMTGAPVLSRKAATLPDGLLNLGAEAPALEVIPLPGHSSDHVGFFIPADSSIVTGDMLFKQSSTLICWPDGNLADYLNSLKHLRELAKQHNIARFLTAHGPFIDDPLGVIDRATRHRLKRLERVRAAAISGASTDVDRIIETVYQDVDIRLDPAVRINIQAQLDYLQREGLLETYDQTNSWVVSLTDTLTYA